MSDFVLRLKETLEPILELPDTRPPLSAYHDMPYALFRYDAEEEFALRFQEAAAKATEVKRGTDALFVAENLQGVETEEQLDEALKGVREECARLIGAGKKVIVQ